MAQLTWEKPLHAEKTKGLSRPAWERYKFLIGGGILLTIVGIMVFSGTLAGARYFISVDNLVGNASYVGQNVRLTGAVLGKTINYDDKTGDLSFTIAHVPDQFDDLATALHEATIDPSRTQLTIVMTNQVKPDLLKNEAQAILTGKMGDDGKFYATELNLKCPSRFGQAVPEVNSSTDQTK